MSSTRSESKIRKHVEFSKDDYEWFIATHHVGDDTLRTGFSAVIAMLLHNYRTVCENPADFPLTGVALIDTTKEAAKETKKELDSVRDLDNS